MSDLTDKVTGRAKQAFGDLTNSASTREEGRKEEAKGDKKEEAARAQEQADEKKAQASELDRES